MTDLVPLLGAATAALLFAWLVQFVAAAFDEFRVKSFLAQRGSQLLQCAWRSGSERFAFFSPARAYLVTYRDRRGILREALCEVGLVSGVHFAAPVAIEANGFDDRVDAVRAEIDSLRRADCA